MERNKARYIPIRDSRLNGWETQTGKLWLPYFPDIKNAGTESPIFAHLILLKQMQSGCLINEDVIDTVCFFAKRGKEELRTKFDKWNKSKMGKEELGYGYTLWSRDENLEENLVEDESEEIDEEVIAKVTTMMADSFGENEEEYSETRYQLISDALRMEDSIFTSVSVN